MMNGPAAAQSRQRRGVRMGFVLMIGTALAVGILATGCDAAYDCDTVAAKLERAERQTDAGIAPDSAVATRAVKCGLLRGMTRREVLSVFEGFRPRDRMARRWVIAAGLTNAWLGPGDGRYLVVRFGPTGKVVRAHIDE